MERLGESCPKTLIVTHFHELFSLKLVEESQLVSFWKMDFIEQEASTRTTPSSSSDPLAIRSHPSTPVEPPTRRMRTSQEQSDANIRNVNAPPGTPTMPHIICLYKLVPGVSKRSFGTYCAVSAGVPQSLMIRASQVANQIAAGLAIEPIDLVPGSLASTATTPSSNFTPDEDDIWNRFMLHLLMSTKPELVAEIAKQVDADGGREEQEQKQKQAQNGVDDEKSEIKAGATMDRQSRVQSRLYELVSNGSISSEQLLCSLSEAVICQLYEEFVESSKPHFRQQHLHNHAQRNTLESVD